jgi:hypothetical protein
MAVYEEKLSQMTSWSHAHDRAANAGASSAALGVADRGVDGIIVGDPGTSAL